MPESNEDIVSRNAQSNQSGNSEWLPIIANGLGIVGSAAGQWWSNRKNRRYQSDQNTLDRQFSWDMMWEKRRQDLDDWNRENAYNNPKAQMERLIAAGLNPNLVYGHGATTTADSPRGSSAPTSSQPAPRMDGSFMTGIMGAVLQLTKQMAETNQLTAQQRLMETEGRLKESNIELNRFDLKQKSALFDTTLDRAVLENQKIKSDIGKSSVESKIMLNRDEREALMNSANLQKTLEEILTIRLQRVKTEFERDEILQKIQLLRKENVLKQFDVELTKQGIRPGDPAYWRYLEKFLSSLGGFLGSSDTGGSSGGKGTPFGNKPWWMFW